MSRNIPASGTVQTPNGFPAHIQAVMPFGGYGDPSNNVFAVSPDDDNDLPNGEPNYIYVGTAGDLRMTLANEEEITIAVTAGYHLFRPTRILATNTDADDIAAFYDNV